MLIVTPNPAIDHTVRLVELRPGEVIRTGPGLSLAGGKGGNVARAAHCLGAAAAVLALVPEVGGDHLRHLYAAEGFELIAVPLAGRVRTCTAMIEDDGRVTLLNEPGAELAPGDWDRLVGTLRELLAGGSSAAAVGRVAGGGAAGGRGPGGGAAGGSSAAGGAPIICSGSLPRGAPADGYAQIVRLGRAAGREVLVDASGAPLAAAVAAGADLVCPNLSEAETIGGAVPSAVAELVDDARDDVPERARAAAAALWRAGARWAVVTAGAAGAAVAGPGHTAWLVPPRVTVRNPIGAGDSFLAGVASARQAGRSWPEAVRRGLAAGSASVEQQSAGVVDPARVTELERQIIAH